MLWCLPTDFILRKHTNFFIITGMQNLLEHLEGWMRSQHQILDWGVVGKLPECLPGERKLRKWLEDGMHGTMQFMQRTEALRQQPHLFEAGARSAVLFLWKYPCSLSLQADTKKHVEDPQIAAYAKGEDYHYAIKKSMRDLQEHLRTMGFYGMFRAFADAEPVAERTLAVLAGLGWLGKNSCLIHPQFGSGFLLGGFFLDREFLQTAVQRPDACASCTRCLDACPTKALVEPGTLDARRCLAYQNIEMRTPLPENTQLHGWLFGCDICQQVCPWNRAHLGESSEQSDCAIYSKGTGPFPQGIGEWRKLLQVGGGFGGRLGRTPLQRAGRRKLEETLEIAWGKQ